MVKMTCLKNYFNVAELQSLCRSLRLSEEGSKCELVERIINRISDDSMEDSTELPLDVSRVCFSNAAISPSPVVEKSTQTQEFRNINQRIGDFNQVFFLIVLAVCFVGACIVILQSLGHIENVEIPVKRSWFN